MRKESVTIATGLRCPPGAVVRYMFCGMTSLLNNGDCFSQLNNRAIFFFTLMLIFCVNKYKPCKVDNAEVLSDTCFVV